MRHFYLPAKLEGDRLEHVLGGRDFRYLSRVLRLREGDTFDAVDASGLPCTARIVRLGRDQLTVEVSAAPPMEDPGPARPRLTLYQCLPKGQKMDIIVRQATEAGVAAIVPVRSERALSDSSAGRIERWRRISIEALQQCGRREPPVICRYTDLGDVVSEPDTGSPAGGGVCSVFFHEDPSGGEPLHRILGAPVPGVRILIGPEGGLSPDEVRLLASSGWRQASLGPTVLRVETAATVAVGSVSILLLERVSWRAEP